MAKTGLSTGAIIGIAIGCSVIVVLFIIIIVFVILKHKAGAKVAAVDDNDPGHEEADDGSRGAGHENDIRESPRMENE